MSRQEKGRLKIFFSYAEGSGKTQAMMKAARTEKLQGADVVVGCIAPHTCVSADLTDGLELLSPDQMPEFDLDRALSRKPDLILLDELAHTNGKGSRHRNRYQDAAELLEAGIDVYTTVNVGNIESLHDRVASVTGTVAWECIPDSVFDNADQVELIDKEPQELMEHLRETETADSRLTLEQLSALREIALLRCADRVKQMFDKMRAKRSFHTDERVLACLSSAPSNGRIIRTAARMADAFNGQFIALFVETPDFAATSEENKERLRSHRRLAEQLGADIETIYGEDVPYQIAEYARLFGITKIVLGSSAVTRRRPFGNPTLTEQLLSYVPEMDIHIIPDKNAEKTYRPRKARALKSRNILENVFKSAAILLAATFLSILFYRLGFTDSNIIMVYILGVLLTSAVTSHQIYSLVSSVASVFIFNFLFTVPRFSLMAYGTGYPVTFVVMFLTAYITGTFAIRCKNQAGQSAKIAYRTKILFDTVQLLSKASGREEIIRAAAEQIQKLLERDIVIFENLDGRLSEPCFFLTDGAADRDYGPQTELAAAGWALKNCQKAGAFTDTFPDAKYLYFPLRVNEKVYGVVGVVAKKEPPDAAECDILLSILGEAALALENEKNAREKEAAAVLAESEQLRANLLRTISHDLRTPLTTISGNASNLMSNGDSFDEETKRQIYSDIYDDSMWLTALVENLLYATRIEEGRMTLRTSTELLGDILEEAVRRIGAKAQKHPLSVSGEDELLLVKVDAQLVVQVITNIIDNAIKYTPPGSPIAVSEGRRDGFAEVQIADSGAGISDDMKEKIFEKFYCGNNKIADNRRSLGLGLYLCRAIIEAHGGTISVTDNHPQGAVFSFTLPLEEVPYHE